MWRSHHRPPTNSCPRQLQQLSWRVSLSTLVFGCALTVILTGAGRAHGGYSAPILLSHSSRTLFPADGASVKQNTDVGATAATAAAATAAIAATASSAPVAAVVATSTHAATTAASVINSTVHIAAGVEYGIVGASVSAKTTNLTETTHSLRRSSQRTGLPVFSNVSHHLSRRSSAIRSVKCNSSANTSSCPQTRPSSLHPLAVNASRQMDRPVVSALTASSEHCLHLVSDTTTLQHCRSMNLWSVLNLTVKHRVTDNNCEPNYIVNYIRELQVLDEQVGRLFSSFSSLIDRFDCQEPYSISFSCKDCKEAYLDWLCSMHMPFYSSEGVRLPPCNSMCERVQLVCPYFLPSERFGLSAQFAGEPTFLCHDPVIAQVRPYGVTSGTCCLHPCCLHPPAGEKELSEEELSEELSTGGRGWCSPDTCSSHSQCHSPSSSSRPSSSSSRGSGSSISNLGTERTQSKRHISNSSSNSSSHSSQHSSRRPSSAAQIETKAAAAAPSDTTKVPSSAGLAPPSLSLTRAHGAASDMSVDWRHFHYRRWRRWRYQRRKYRHRHRLHRRLRHRLRHHPPSRHRRLQQHRWRRSSLPPIPVRQSRHQSGTSRQALTSQAVGKRRLKDHTLLLLLLPLLLPLLVVVVAMLLLVGSSETDEAAAVAAAVLVLVLCRSVDEWHLRNRPALS